MAALSIGETHPDIGPNNIFLVDFAEGGHGNAVIDATENGHNGVDLPDSLEAELSGARVTIGLTTRSEN